MLRFSMQGKNGRKIIGFGITQANVDRMVAGQPLQVSLEDFGLSSEKIDFVIAYGKDIKSLNEQFAPFVGPNTKIVHDPLLDQAPEDARIVKEGQNKGKME